MVIGLVSTLEALGNLRYLPTYDQHIMTISAKPYRFAASLFSTLSKVNRLSVRGPRMSFPGMPGGAGGGATAGMSDQEAAMVKAVSRSLHDIHS